jgi:hypothetical protein
VLPYSFVVEEEIEVATYKKQIKKSLGAAVLLLVFCVATFISTALAAGRGVGGGSRGVGFSGRSHHQPRFDHFRGRGFLVGDGFGDTDVIIEQSQTTVAAEPAKPVNKGRYVPPRWVDGGYGVEVLQPGYWTGPEKETTR